MRIGSATQPGSSDPHALVEMSVDVQFQSSIHFAIKSFEEEAETGTNHPRECRSILQGLRKLTDHYVSPTKQADLCHSNVIDHAYSVLQADTNSNSVTDLRTSQTDFGLGGADYEELMSWMQNDTLHLHI
jgi:hypothetical protein